MGLGTAMVIAAGCSVVGILTMSLGIDYAQYKEHSTTARIFNWRKARWIKKHGHDASMAFLKYNWHLKQMGGYTWNPKTSWELSLSKNDHGRNIRTLLVLANRSDTIYIKDTKELIKLVKLLQKSDDPAKVIFNMSEVTSSFSKANDKSLF